MKHAFLIVAGLIGLMPVTSLTAGPAGFPVTVYLTAKDTDKRLARIGELTFSDLPQPVEQDLTIFVDPSKTYQTILGIGGALTDAAAETFYKLPRDKQRELLRAYFDPQNGLGYSLGRTHINSCDFSSHSYTYVRDGDTKLESFDLAPDRQYRIPFIKEVLATAGRDFSLFVSAWSPPAWMKSNGDMLHGGTLKPEYRSAWANYFVKFIKAYESAGIPIWGLTVQNEPMATQTFESCVFTAEAERDFLKDYLGPTLKKAGLGDKKICIWDHNRGLMYQRAAVVLEDPAAAKYVWGVAFHWYTGDHFENVQRVHEAFPKVNLLFTEGCLYPFDPATLDEWHWGETYGKSMINDFNNGTVGWTDWNVLLDQQGGPNHVGNFCLAPVIADTRTGGLHYLNSFYYIGHFSKFVRPGARRIACSSTLDDVLSTAFVNPDGKVAVIVLNLSDKEQPLNLWCAGQAAKSSSPAHSIMTFVFAAKK